MLKKKCSLTLAGLTLHLLLLLPTPAAAQAGGDPQPGGQVKAEVAALGVGSRVAIRLRDKRKLMGYIAQIGDDDFVITKAQEGTKQAVAYAEVTQIKQKNEKRISTAGKILIVWGVMGLVGLIATGGGG